MGDNTGFHPDFITCPDDSKDDNPKPVKGEATCTFYHILKAMFEQSTFLSQMSGLFDQKYIKDKYGQGRHVIPLGMNFVSVAEMCRRLKQLLLKEARYQLLCAAKNAGHGVSQHQVVIDTGTFLNIDLDQLGISFNELVYLSSKSQIHGHMDPSNFGVVRARHVDGVDTVHIHIAMLSDATANGSWYVHPILNLTTFERTYVALTSKFPRLLRDQLLATQGQQLMCDDASVAGVDVAVQGLSREQEAAIRRICATIGQPDAAISIVEGPPGTGKTTFLRGLVATILVTLCGKTGKLAVTGATNATVGDITHRFMAPGMNILEPGSFLMVVGHPTQLDPRSHPYALFSYLSATIKVMASLYKAMCRYRKLLGCTLLDRLALGQCSQLRALRKFFEPMERLPCRPDAIIRKLRDICDDGDDGDDGAFTDRMISCGLFDSSPDDACMKRIDTLLAEIKPWTDKMALTGILIRSASLVLCTASQTRSAVLESYSFEIVIMEEAGQITQAEAMLPLGPDTRQLILIGDDKQLPGFVKSPVAQAAGFRESLMSRLLKNNKDPEGRDYPVYRLCIQYRMHPDISKFPIEYVYGGLVKNGPSVLKLSDMYNGISPYAVVIVKGQEIVDKNEFSYKNPQEVDAIAAWISDHLELITPSQITVISPYGGQRDLLENALAIYPGVTVSTIDGYQGQENDVILLSIVRTGGHVGFMGQLERLNVALTRARNCLRIFGDLRSFARANPHWNALLEDATRRDLVLTHETRPRPHAQAHRGGRGTNNGRGRGGRGTNNSRGRGTNNSGSRGTNNRGSRGRGGRGTNNRRGRGRGTSNGRKRRS